ncbi:lamin tail domain-containing protein [Kytococcus sedentarius]|uniref:lamin tail domain-containing protein n=1 Tax=Kytococcus sedentarius TaxID=1276 RepID=UPI00384D7EEF
MNRHSRMLGGLTSAALLAPAMLIAPAAEALPAIMISQIVYDSFGATKDDYSTRSLNAEYIVLKNTTSVSRTVTGWTVKDATGFRYTLPTTTIPAKGTVRIHTGKGTNTNARGATTPGHRYWGKTSYVWNNTGDTATLRNRAGSLMDTCKYTDKSTKDSIKSVAC